MKPIVFFFFIILCNISYSQSSFSDGYEEGYKKGYCLEDITCVPPIAPIAPIPAPGYSTYSDGYARGVQAGQSKRQSDKTSTSLPTASSLPAPATNYSGSYSNPKVVIDNSDAVVGKAISDAGANIAKRTTLESYMRLPPQGDCAYRKSCRKDPHHQ